jgi:hypothetical protein
MTLPFPDSPNTGENIADSITWIEQNLEYLDGNLTTRSSKIDADTRLLNAATGDVNYAVSDITAQGILIMAYHAGDVASWGFLDEDGTGYCMYRDYNGDFAVDTSNAINITTSATISQKAVWKAYNSGSFDLTWTKAGAGGATAINLIFLLLS